MQSLKKCFISWSSGKDAAMALHRVQQNGHQVERLVTTINDHFRRVSMHGLRKELVEEQAKSIGIPLQSIGLPREPSMEEYDRIIQETNDQLIQEGFTHCVFGDIFLEDLRTYRENLYKDVSCDFPIWKENTSSLIQKFIEQRFKAIIICVDTRVLDESFVGREIDENFLNDLPSDVDPCGENGEFHTFCFDGPIFSNPIAFEKGEVVTRTYEINKEDDGSVIMESATYAFLDLLLPNSSS